MKTDTQLLQKLEQAAVCCKDCGLRWGHYSVGCSSTWIGRCGVCGQERPVTETRDYGFLHRGRRELLLRLQG